VAGVKPGGSALASARNAIAAGEFDVALAVAPELPHKNVGIRPGEKLHEVMITEDDARMTPQFSNFDLPERQWAAVQWRLSGST
jgi:FlaA1/EpsC-like NDP-sugar epimerase